MKRHFKTICYFCYLVKCTHLSKLSHNCTKTCKVLYKGHTSVKERTKRKYTLYITSVTGPHLFPFMAVSIHCIFRWCCPQPYSSIINTKLLTLEKSRIVVKAREVSLKSVSACIYHSTLHTILVLLSKHHTKSWTAMDKLQKVIQEQLTSY